MGVKAEDLAGRIFDRLTVLRRSSNPKFKTPAWVCLCACGEQVEVRAASLKIGSTRSCGCLNTETRAASKFVHGKSTSPGYGSWKSMISRCTNPADKDWPEYGCRGITVCQRWMDVSNFLVDMGPKPSRASIERIDNNKGYYPENCRWATPAEQGANKRNNRVFVVFGEAMHFAEICRRFDVKESTLMNRLKAGADIEAALTTPIRRRNRRKSA